MPSGSFFLAALGGMWDLAARPVIELSLSSVETQILNCQTTRKVPVVFFMFLAFVLIHYSFWFSSNIENFQPFKNFFTYFPPSLLFPSLHVDPQLIDSLFFFFFNLSSLLSLILANFCCCVFRFPCHLFCNFKSPLSPIQCIFHLTHGIFYLWIFDLCLFNILHVPGSNHLKPRWLLNSALVLSPELGNR